MFEKTNHRDEDHVDERAHSFFSFQYSGKGAGYYWDFLSEEIIPTATLGGGGAVRFCAYCGRQALPIQERKYSHRTGQDEYKNKGHCCVCKDAMDEVDMVKKMEEITKQFEAALSQCRQAMPNADPEVVLAIMDLKNEEAKKSFKFWMGRDKDIPLYHLKDTGVDIEGSRYKKGGCE